MKIAYSPNFGYAEVDSEVATLVKAAVDVFAKLGAIVEEVDPDLLVLQAAKAYESVSPFIMPLTASN